MILTSRQQAHITRVFDVVFELTGATRAEIVGSKTTREIVESRCIAIYCVKATMDLSLHRIGMIFGNRDYTTIHLALKKIKTRMAHDGDLNDKVEEAMNQLGANKSRDCEFLRLIHDAQALINKAAAMIGASEKKFKIKIHHDND